MRGLSEKKRVTVVTGTLKASQLIIARISSITPIVEISEIFSTPPAHTPESTSRLITVSIREVGSYAAQKPYNDFAGSWSH